jgi:hypothetical protein
MSRPIRCPDCPAFHSAYPTADHSVNAASIPCSYRAEIPLCFSPFLASLVGLARCVFFPSIASICFRLPDSKVKYPFLTTITYNYLYIALSLD